MNNDLPNSFEHDTQAWQGFVWISFGLSLLAAGTGLLFLPLDPWHRGFFAVSFLFSVSAAFTLSKTLRDRHESQKVIARLQQAKAEKILRDYEKETAA